MAEDPRTRELIEAVVADAFDQHVRTLHDEIVVRVMSTIEAAEKRRPEKPVSAWLKSAVEGIESSSQQSDILKSLLDGAGKFAARTALFVLRGNTAVVWQARGFQDDEALKSVSVNVNKGACAVAIQERAATTGRASEFGERFAIDGADRDCVVIPLTIRDKVAALLYGDSTSDESPTDVCGLEMLVRAAGNWIEMQALRKSAGMPAPKPSAGAASKAAMAPEREAAQPAQEAASVPAPAAKPVKEAPASPESVNPVSNFATHMDRDPDKKHNSPAPVHGEPGTAQIPPEELELHRKARRFAKLLVDEIILYNRAKVNEGRLKHDLYDRLKDDIDKSRTTYQKRYAETSVANYDYFTQAVITGLAERNPVLLGSNFPH
jgi:putative methionine-R-sulfoxide reductase with GAF domain